jgi:O-antigen/teichoic acid export membrane protein
VANSVFSRFASGAFSVGAGSLSVMTTGLAGVMIVARILPAEVYGVFILIQVMAAFLTRISSFGLNISVARFVSSAEDPGQSRQLINTAFCFRLLTFPLIGLVIYLGTPLLAMLFDVSAIDRLYPFIFLLFALSSLEQVIKSALQGLFLFKAIAKFDLIASVLGFVLLILFVLLLGQGLLGLIYAKVISAAVAVLFGYLLIPTRKKIEFNVGQLKNMLRFGFPLQLNDVLTFFFLRIDTLMIGALLGPAQIAYYEIARKIPESIAGLYEAFRVVFFPFISRFLAQKERIQAAAVMNHSTRLLSFFSIASALIALLFGREIIVLFFSDQYVDSVYTFVILMAGLAFAFTDYTLGYTLVAAGDADKPVYINVVHTGVTLLGNYLLIPIFGIFGAALANIAGFAATNPLNVFFLHRRGIPVKIGNYLIPILIFGGFWLATTQVELEGILIKLAAFVLFLAISLFTSVITREDLQIISAEVKALAYRWQQKASSQSSHP